VALHTETVVVEQVALGRPNADGVAPKTTTLITIEGCNVQPVGTEESLGDAEPITGRWRVSTAVNDPHDEIRARDVVKWRGGSYEVRGRVQTFHAIRPHTEFIISETRG
jgi:hypothetical protein